MHLYCTPLPTAPHHPKKILATSFFFTMLNYDVETNQIPSKIDLGDQKIQAEQVSKLLALIIQFSVCYLPVFTLCIFILSTWDIQVRPLHWYSMFLLRTVHITKGSKRWIETHDIHTIQSLLVPHPSHFKCDRAAVLFNPLCVSLALSVLHNQVSTLHTTY